MPKKENPAILCGPVPPIGRWKTRKPENLTTGQKVLAFIQAYCLVPEGAKVGQPLELEPFQAQFIVSIYDNPALTRHAYLSIARKNGKTALIAALVLAHLVGPVAQRNSQIISGALSRDQAALVYNLAEKMVLLNPELEEHVRVVPSYKKLIGLPLNVEYKAISAEGKTAHGLSPILAILDEIGQVIGPHSAFIDAITTSQGAHQAPLLIAISTSAPSDGDLFNMWIDDSAASKDPSTVTHYYTAEKDCDLLDKSQWKRANPALGKFRSMKDLEEQLSQAQRLPSLQATVRNLLLNQRVAVENPFITPGLWDACGGEVPDQVFMDNPVYCGLDLSARNDLTALTLVVKADNGITYVKPYAWTPGATVRDRETRDRVPYSLWVEQGYLLTTPGVNIQYDFISAEIAEILAPLRVAGIAFDRWRINHLTECLDRIGAHHVLRALKPWGQGYRDMSPCMDETESVVLAEKLAHGGNPVLRWAVSNVIVSTDPAGNRKPDKKLAINRIDPAAAMFMGIGLANQKDESQSVYSRRREGLIIL